MPPLLSQRPEAVLKRIIWSELLLFSFIIGAYLWHESRAVESWGKQKPLFKVSLVRSSEKQSVYSQNRWIHLPTAIARPYTTPLLPWGQTPQFRGWLWPALMLMGTGCGLADALKQEGWALPFFSKWPVQGDTQLATRPGSDVPQPQACSFSHAFLTISNPTRNRWAEKEIPEIPDAC